MTAKEFVRKRDILRDAGLWWILFVFLVTGVITFFNARHLHDPINVVAVKYLILYVFVLLVGPVISGILSRRFVAKHPEMEYLSKWEGLGGSIEDYPLTPEERKAIADEVTLKLTGFATRVNAVSTILDSIFSPPKDVSPEEEWEIANIKELVEDRVISNTVAYHAYWNLVVVELRILEFIDPNEFRKGLLRIS